DAGSAASPRTGGSPPRSACVATPTPCAAARPSTSAVLATTGRILRRTRGTLSRGSVTVGDRRSPQGAGRPQLGDPRLVVAEHLAQDLVGVLADGRRPGRHRQGAVDPLDRRRPLLGAPALPGQQGHAGLEPRVTDGPLCGGL